MLGTNRQGSPSPSNNSNEQRSRSESGNENDEEKDENVEEIKSSEPSQLPIPNLNLPGFPAGLMQNLPQNLPNFDPSNLPQGVREFAMLQQQQLAQVLTPTQ